MIVYIEREILLDAQCRELYLCDNALNDEYLIISSAEQCSCKKRRVVLCQYDHDHCEKRCSSESSFFLKRNNQANEIFLNNQPINVVLLEKDELQNNAEIVYICEASNLPKAILEHLKNQLTFTEISFSNRVRRSTFPNTLFRSNLSRRLL